MQCPQCDAEIREDGLYCPKCGEQLQGLGAESFAELRKAISQADPVAIEPDAPTVLRAGKRSWSQRAVRVFLKVLGMRMKDER